MIKIVILAAWLCLAGGLALAQSVSQTVSACENPNPVTAIPGCTAIINDSGDMGAYLFEAYANRSIAEINLGQFNAAIGDATQAIALNPENAKIYITRARAEGAANQPDQVIADTGRAIELNAADADAYRLRGTAEGQKSLWPQAIADETRAIALNPKDPQSYWTRARVYRALQKWPQSQADISKLIELDPNDTAARMFRAGAFLEANQPSLALPDIQKVLQLQPANPAAKMALALVYKEQKQWPQEIAQLSRLLQSGNLNAHGDLLAYIERAQAYAQLHRLDNAIADLAQAIALNPLNPDLYVARAQLYGQKAEYGPEIADDNKAIALAPKDVAAYMDRAGAFENQNMFAEAIPDNTAVLAIISTEPLFWNNRCWDRAHVGDLRNALTDCKRALALSPKFAAALDSTGYVYLKLQDYAASVAEYDVSLKTDPTQASSFYGRALAEQALGRKTAAAADHAKALQLDPGIATNF